MNAFDFTSKVVIVTGASSGIGAATAILFAEFGAKLVLVGRNEERLKTVFVQCHQARGVKPLYLQLDLTEKFSCEKVISATVAEFGRIDVLVNSAGKLLLGSLFDEESDVLDELIDIYIKVPYKLTNLAIPHLVKTKGNIVNVASTNDRQRQGFLPQFIAQHGLSNFTKLAASELASAGVRINSVNPGITRTNILKNIGLSELEISHTYEKLMTSLNIKVLEPSEVARMIVFIASDVCPGMNGADMRIDGGLQS